MIKQTFKKLIFSHPKAQFELLKNEWQMQKVCELIDIFNEQELEELAFIIGLDEEGILKKEALSLKTFCFFVKSYILQDAYYLAKRTELKGGEKLTNYDKTRILSAFYVKKLLKKVPEWAHKIVLNNENEIKK